MTTIATTPRPVNRKPFAPFTPTAAGYVEPSDEDHQWAARNLNAEPEPDYDLLAGEAVAIDAMGDMTPPPAACVRCGEPSDALSWGMCPDCLDDAATDAAIACQNRRAMGQFRVF